MRVVRIAHVDGYTQQFQIAVLGDPGRIYTPYVTTEFPVRLRRIANGDVKKYTKDIDYPLKKACTALKRVGSKQGITKGAKQLLSRAWA